MTTLSIWHGGNGYDVWSWRNISAMLLLLLLQNKNGLATANTYTDTLLWASKTCSCCMNYP